MKLTVAGLLFFTLCSTSCVSTNTRKISKEFAEAGTTTILRNQSVSLYPGSLKKGDNLYAIVKQTLGKELPKKVAIINIVPSIDTKVCEEQTHILGESKEIPEDVSRLTISRDLPMAQKRFASAANLNSISYLSDYKFGSFGKKTGLLIKDHELLTRAVIVTDKNGVIRHLQIVPNISELPDMDKAIEIAKQLNVSL